jgi:hypothetical protein
LPPAGSGNRTEVEEEEGAGGGGEGIGRRIRWQWPSARRHGHRGRPLPVVVPLRRSLPRAAASAARSLAPQPPPGMQKVGSTGLQGPSRHALLLEDGNGYHKMRPLQEAAAAPGGGGEGGGRRRQRCGRREQGLLDAQHELGSDRGFEQVLRAVGRAPLPRPRSAVAAGLAAPPPRPCSRRRGCAASCVRPLLDLGRRRSDLRQPLLNSSQSQLVGRSALSSAPEGGGIARRERGGGREKESAVGMQHGADIPGMRHVRARLAK